MVDTAHIKTLIETGLPGATVVVEDPMHDGQHLRAIVTSAGFAGKTRIEQHRMVYAALGGAFDGALHALQLETRTS